ncbi:MAG: hypothetical protein OEU48_11530, partial [Gammaproteobacteria bacterium]|nr:hypothetical protein [Gammaproteobacteria bacterium]
KFGGFRDDKAEVGVELRQMHESVQDIGLVFYHILIVLTNRRLAPFSGVNYHVAELPTRSVMI